MARLYGGHRHYRLQQKYGIGAADVDARVAAQGGLCAICRLQAAVQVDHDHGTARVRGILCDGAMGHSVLRESEILLLKAIEYLDRWN